jgi:hypothetical protein
MTVTMKITVFWGVIPCSLVDHYRYFRATSCFAESGDSRFFEMFDVQALMCLQVDASICYALEGFHTHLFKYIVTQRINISLH